MAPGLLSWKLIASATIPLVVGLLNLLVGGYVLLLGLRRDRGRLWFALGPLGVTAWALAWFVSVFNPEALGSMRILGSIGGFLSVLGFARDGLVRLEKGRTAITLGLIAGVFASALALGAVKPAYLSFASVTRLGALACIGAALTGAFVQRRSEALALEAKLAGQMIRLTVAAGLGFVALLVLAILGKRAPSDPMLFAVLLSQVYALLYINARRIDVHALLSRTVSYLILSVLTAAVAAIVFRLLGYELDLVAVTVTVAVALLSSALFMGLSDRLTRSIEGLIFPDHAKTQKALLASQGELRALRRRLERAEKLAITGELAASVAHEIKNPLAPIRGYAQLLGGRLDEVSQSQRPMFEKGLRIIRDETDRIDRRVAELLELARADRAHASIASSCDLHEIIADVCAVAQGEPGITAIHTRIEPDLPAVRGDGEELRGALLNLLKNAAEAMGETEPGAIQLDARAVEDQVILEVKDEGPGLTPQQADRVFAAFYTTKSGGTGLGLAIARSAVEAAGGSIALGPRTDGERPELRPGACVRICLLLADEVDSETDDDRA